MKKILLSLICAIPMAQAQELNLFEDIEVEQPRANVRQNLAARTQKKQTEPAFTLQGTSHIGSTFTATLNTRDGQILRVKWKEGGTMGINGLNGYRLLAVNSRSVSVSYPPDQPCQEFPDKGVECADSGNIGVVKLSTAEPIKVAKNQPRAAVSENPVISTDENGEVIDPVALAEEEVTNPFVLQSRAREAELSPEEREARAARARERAERLRGFAVRRIEDDEIPEGMRRVRTPFGDTLVQDDQ